MANVFDVAEYVLQKQGPMTTFKLQKLCYYSQAWSLVWDSEPLFDERIEAWANGPVIPALYEKHRGVFVIVSLDVGDKANLNDSQIDTIDSVLSVYGDKRPEWLSALTHKELPWINARERAGLIPGERGDSEITLDDMAEYYGGLQE